MNSSNSHVIINNGSITNFRKRKGNNLLRVRCLSWAKRNMRRKKGRSGWVECWSNNILKDLENYLNFRIHSRKKNRITSMTTTSINLHSHIHNNPWLPQHLSNSISKTSLKSSSIQSHWLTFSQSINSNRSGLVNKFRTTWSGIIWIAD